MRGVALAIALLAGTAACEDRSYRDVGAEISVLTKRTDALVGPATDRLVAFGSAALPQLEIATHTASVRGKLNLLRALDRIAHPGSAAILRQMAVYDPAVEVRAACEQILRRWAGEARTAAAAKAALRRIEEKRGRGEGPVVVGGTAAGG